ncbi:DUF6249 domain-containing protein [Winogradskyella pacifica]|uniref:DUF6249 domain-containing protein n=1 Tax=Winogradskyella pacifica TaxID=664642 RepID=A0A3D9MWH8_9FLAO|nr:DUF6249 domain-containing protein [Winogradskyella pacifica]REE24341.1 hypothetical protein DFQ09_104112 [Winogradskyella pacifica]
MNEGILVPISMFLVIFGIIYLYLSTRNKERLALIEKGADASIFLRGHSKSPIWKVILLNLALLLMGIGLGMLIASILEKSLAVVPDAIYPGVTFTTAGISLFIGYIMTKNLDKE